MKNHYSVDIYNLWFTKKVTGFRKKDVGGYRDLVTLDNEGTIGLEVQRERPSSKKD